MDLRAVSHALERQSPALGVRLRLWRKHLRHDVTLSLVRRLVHSGDHVVDVGAYRGVYTLELSRLVGPRGRVVAVEPFPPNAAAVQRVTARRGNVVVFAGGASDKAGRRRLAVPVHQGRNLGALATLGAVGTATETVEVDVRTLDELLEERPAPARPVTFVRCDVVGHEAAVLAGADRVLRTHQPALLVEIEQRHQPSPVQATFDLLLGYGYEGYFIRGPSLFPLASFDLRRDQLSLVPAGFVPYGMPADYVHYFLFVRPGAVPADLVGNG